jgi:RNA polymerase sigma-70 factor (ECF subfamily)
VIQKDQIAALVHRAKAGEPEAMERLVREYLKPAYAVALTILGRPSDAEDAAQDAFLTAFERIDACRENEKFVAWLFQIVRNQARNFRTKRKLRDVPKELPINEPVEMGRSPEVLSMQRDLLRALSDLTEAQQEVVLLHDLLGWTHLEIAEALTISEVMSRQQLFCARKSIRAALS